jgi:hypothetical protein
VLSLSTNFYDIRKCPVPVLFNEHHPEDHDESGDIYWRKFGDGQRPLSERGVQSILLERGKTRDYVSLVVRTNAISVLNSILACNGITYENSSIADGSDVTRCKIKDASATIDSVVRALVADGQDETLLPASVADEIIAKEQTMIRQQTPSPPLGSLPMMRGGGRIPPSQADRSNGREGD